MEGGWRGASQQGVYHIKGFSLAAFFLSSEYLPPLRAFLSLTHHVHSPIHERARARKLITSTLKQAHSLSLLPPHPPLSLSLPRSPIVDSRCCCRLTLGLKHGHAPSQKYLTKANFPLSLHLLLSLPFSHLLFSNSLSLSHFNSIFFSLSYLISPFNNLPLSLALHLSISLSPFLLLTLSRSLSYLISRFNNLLSLSLALYLSLSNTYCISLSLILLTRTKEKSSN